MTTKPTPATGHSQDWSVVEPVRTLEEYLQSRQDALSKAFPKDSGVDKESLILACHALHDARVYPQGRGNVLGPENIMRIADAG